MTLLKEGHSTQVKIMGFSWRGETMGDLDQSYPDFQLIELLNREHRSQIQVRGLLGTAENNMTLSRFPLHVLSNGCIGLINRLIVNITVSEARAHLVVSETRARVIGLPTSSPRSSRCLIP
jgi:hypothetical protein